MDPGGSYSRCAGRCSSARAGAQARRAPVVGGRAAWRLACAAGCVVRYQLDLSAAAAASRNDPEVALESGGDVFAPASAWMLRRAGADEEALQRDWVLVHELFHLGVPSFWRERRWLDEGLATYCEAVLRTRAGRPSTRRCACR